MIYVVGLGVKQGDIALNGYKLIEDKSKKIVVKTQKSATYCYFDGCEHYGRRAAYGNATYLSTGVQQKNTVHLCKLYF